MDSTSYEYIESPTHYNKYSVEVIEMFRRIYGDELTAYWCEMTAMKYRMRMGTKPNEPMARDLGKEEWYLRKAGELRECIRQSKTISKDNDIREA